jgi:AraC family transcriptional activator of pobA
MATQRKHPGSHAGRPAAPVPAFFLYGEALQPPDERLIHVETIAERSSLHDWNIRPHRHHDLHQLLLVRRGNVNAQLDAMQSSLRPPALLVVPPGIVHSFRFRPGTVGFVVSFASGLVAELQSTSPGLGLFLEQPALLALDRDRAQATDLMQAGDMLLREFGRSAPARHLALRGLLGVLLANAVRLADSQPTADAARLAPERELVARFRHLVEQWFREQRPLSHYAEALRISPLQLRRACLGQCGQPPIELVQQRLLLEAERQLRYTSMSVAQVAYHLGFNDPAYFTRFFTRRMRISPRTFRARDESTTAG